MKKSLVITLLISILSILVLSGCDVYNTLYVKQPPIDEEGAEVIDDEDIMTEEDFTEMEEGVEEVEEEEIVEEEISIDIPEEEVEEAEEEDVVEEEVTEVSAPEDATVIIVEETEKVSLAPRAQDPDDDVLLFTFTNPLDEEGEWQTTYGDAGEYTVTVTASDGTLTASKQALIIIKRKEEAPVIEGATPEDQALEIEETETLEFAIIATDLNNDELTYAWKLDGVDVSETDSYTYDTTYEDSGSHTIKVDVTDGVFDTEQIWSVTVNNVNRIPILEELDDVDARETDTIILELEAFDEDGDVLAFTINDERFEQDENVFTWETDYDASGEHLITISATDGTDEVTQDIVITVENVNRAPIILDIVQQE